MHRRSVPLPHAVVMQNARVQCWMFAVQVQCSASSSMSSLVLQVGHGKAERIRTSSNAVQFSCSLSSVGSCDLCERIQQGEKRTKLLKPAAEYKHATQQLGPERTTSTRDQPSGMQLPCMRAMSCDHHCLQSRCARGMSSQHFKRIFLANLTSSKLHFSWLQPKDISC